MVCFFQITYIYELKKTSIMSKNTRVWKIIHFTLFIRGP